MTSVPLLPATAAPAVAVATAIAVCLCHRSSVLPLLGASVGGSWSVAGDRLPLQPPSLAVGGLGLLCSVGYYGY